MTNPGDPTFSPGDSPGDNPDPTDETGVARAGVSRRKKVLIGLALVVAAVGVSDRLVAWTSGAVDGTDNLTIEFAKKNPCTYDRDTETFNARLLIRAHTTGRVKVIATVTVDNEDSLSNKTPSRRLQGETSVIVHGAHRSLSEVKVHVPRRDYDNGFTQCMLSGDFKNAGWLPLP